MSQQNSGQRDRKEFSCSGERWSTSGEAKTSVPPGINELRPGEREREQSKGVCTLGGSEKKSWLPLSLLFSRPLTSLLLFSTCARALTFPAGHSPSSNEGTVVFRAGQLGRLYERANCYEILHSLSR